MNINKVFKIPRLLTNGKKLAAALHGQMAGRGVIGDNGFHIEAGVRWLMRAGEKGGGGFSRSFCFYRGWDKPYIETTGYIIPTMIAAGRCIGDARITESAEHSARWLLGMQKKNGAFGDTDTGTEQVFDTGQVLTGLITAFRQWGDPRFLDAASRAGEWLSAVQEEDGAWEKYAYNRMKHAYYVKVAAALLELFAETGEDRFRETALKNIHWTLGQQRDDGYFEHMQFRREEYPFLHTIMYVLEGLLDAYESLKDERILESAMKTVSALGGINRDRDMLLCSQYGENWAPVNRERCLTGLAQWAAVAIRTHEISGEESLREQAVRTIYYLKSKQFLRSDQDLYGGLPGSVPLWGRYLSFCYPNWGVKFFLDALLLYERWGVPLWREQEIWVSGAFSFSGSVVGDDICANDRKYLNFIEKEVDAGRDLTVLDIGCGKGKFIRYFREKYPHWTITGVDPSFSGLSDVRAGGVYELPLPDGYADVVLLIEVMQHIDHMPRAMAELSRVTKTGGLLVIGDRDRFSVLGALKPFLETAGLWMYPWDSPFRERWRSLKEWRGILDHDWRVTFARSFDSPGNRIPGSNRFYLLTARKRDL